MYSVCNSNPFLVCEGKCKIGTPHHFIGKKTISRTFRRSDWPRDWMHRAPQYNKDVTGLVFACDQCGFERLWGF